MNKKKIAIMLNHTIAKAFRKILHIYHTKIFSRIPGSIKYGSFLINLALLDIRKNSIPFRTILDKDWDYLILLDACRYDILKEIMKRKIGYLISVGSNTFEWLKNTFKKEYYDIIYVSANPIVLYFIIKKCKGKTLFFHLENVWKYGWDKKLNTVPPSKVTEVVLKLAKRFPRKKMIIHFLQPHPPFIGYKKYKYVSNIWRLFVEGKMSKEEFWAAYKSNLYLVMKEVRKLVKYLKVR